MREAVRDVDYFKPLVGTRTDSPRFKEAIDQLSLVKGEQLSWKVVNAKDPKDCEVDDPLKWYYPNERLLVISSYSGEIESIYRASRPYPDRERYAEKYPDGDIPYILPRYPATIENDVSMTSFMLYYTGITAYRYLEVISSTFPTAHEDRRNMSDDNFISIAIENLRENLHLRDYFSKDDSDSPQIAAQKIYCEKHYTHLIKQIAKIAIRRARPFTTTSLEETLEKALTPMKEEVDSRREKNAPIMGANDDMSITLRYLVLSLRLIIQDYRKFHGDVYDKEEYARNCGEFLSINTYLMAFSEFVNAQSHGLVIEPNKKEIQVFSAVTREIHGEIGKLGKLLLPPLNKKKNSDSNPIEERIEEKSAKRLEYISEFMLGNRVHKVSRACYYVDLAVKTLSENTDVGENEQLFKLIESSAENAKVKIFTAASAKVYSEVLQEYEAETTKLKHKIKSTHLPQQTKNAINVFITELDSMTETKRRRENAPDNIEEAANSKQRSHASRFRASIQQSPVDGENFFQL